MLRVIFMGTPDFSEPTLAAIIDAGHDVVSVYSQPPRRAGRGKKSRKTPIHVFAESAGLNVRTPKSLRRAPEQTAFAALGADVAVVVAYGLILPKAILDAPRFGCLNLHASALPRWRGAAPLQRAIMAGDSETAAIVMQMDEGLDTGPVCAALTQPIGPNMTAGELHDVMSLNGAKLVVQALQDLQTGTLTCTPQSDDGTCYAKKIDKSEAEIDFAKPAKDVHNLIRGLSPFPGAWCEIRRIGKPERLKVLHSELVQPGGTAANSGAANTEPGTVLDDQLTIACGKGAVRLVQVQRAGRRPMSATEFLRGTILVKGQIVGGGVPAHLR